MASRGKAKILEAVSDVPEMYRSARETFNARRRTREEEGVRLTRGQQVRWDDLSFLDVFGDETPRVHNIIRPIIRAATATALRQRPNIQIPSAFSDHATQAKAKMTEQLCQSFMRNGVFDWDEWYRAVFSSKTTGLAWIKTVFNATGGRILLRNPDEMMFGQPEEGPELDPFGHLVEDVDYEGEIEQHFVSSFEGLPDPAARSFKTMRYIEHVRMLPKSQLEDMFETDWDGKKVNFGRSDSGNEAQRRAIDAAVDGHVDHAEDELCELVGHWELPTREYGNGRFVLFSGNTFLEIGPNPLFPVRLPFTPIYGDNIVPGSLYPDGIVEDLKSPQADINMSKTKIFEWIERNINEYIMAPHGSGIDEDHFDNKAGRIVGYNRGYAPERMTANDIPATVFNHAADQIEGANRISGYEDVTRGAMPQADLSGRALAYLRENEESSRAPEQMRMRQSMVDACQEAVFFARQFYEPGRYVQMVGENSAWRTREFLEDDYDFENQLVPEIFSGRPNSPALRTSETLEMAERGIFAETPEAKRIRRRLAIDHDQMDTLDDAQPDREKAYRVLMALKENPFARVMAEEFDDNAIHMEEIDNFRKTVEFEQMSPVHREAINRLHDQHDEMLDWKQQVEAMMGQPMSPEQGGVPGAPGQGGSPMNGGHATYPTEEPSMDQAAVANSQF